MKLLIKNVLIISYLLSFLFIRNIYAQDSDELSLGNTYNGSFGTTYTEVINLKAQVKGVIKNSQKAGTFSKNTNNQDTAKTLGAWNILEKSSLDSRASGVSAKQADGNERNERMVVINNDTQNLVVVEGIKVKAVDRKTAEEIRSFTGWDMNIYSTSPSNNSVLATYSGNGNPFEMADDVREKFGERVMRVRVMLFENENIPY